MGASFGRTRRYQIVRRSIPAIHFSGIRHQAKLVAIIVHACKPECRMKTQACAGPAIAGVVTTSKPGPRRRALDQVYVIPKPAVFVRLEGREA